MKKIALTIATAALALGTIGHKQADARGFGRGVALGLIGASLVVHAARAEQVRARRAAEAAAYARARRAKAEAKARAVAAARAKAAAAAVAKAKAAAQAQARLAAQKAEVARLKAQNEKLQQNAVVEAPAQAPVQAPIQAPQPVQTAQTPSAAAPVVKPVEVKPITGECKRFIPSAGITVSAPCP
jgi:hypothetical protein